MRKLITLVLAILLFTSVFAVNTFADSENAETYTTELQTEIFESQNVPDSIENTSEPQAEVLPGYSVEQNENGDLVLTFDSKEHAELVDTVYFEEVSKAKVGPSGVWKDSLVFEDNKVVVTFNVIKNILQLKNGSTYKVYIAVSQNGIIDTTSREITLNKGAENWDITAWVDDDSNLFIESTNSFINKHINWIRLDEGTYIDGYDSGPLFNRDEIINTDEYTYVPGSYLKTFKLQNNVDFKVEIKYLGEDGDQTASNRFFINPVQFNYEQMIGPNLVGEVKNGILYIKSENNNPQGKDYLNALYNNGNHYSDELSFNIAIEDAMCGVAGFDSDILEFYEDGLKIKLYKYLHNIDYTDSDKNELVLRVPSMGMSKVLFYLDDEGMKSDIDLITGVHDNRIISLKIEDKEIFDKVYRGEYQIAYEPFFNLFNEEQNINSKYLSFDTSSNVVFINYYFGAANTLAISIKDEDEIIAYTILDNYYGEIPDADISPEHYVEAGTDEAKNIIKLLRENEEFVSYSDDLLNNSIVLNTRAIEFGTTNTMQTWLPYFLGNADELGIDYSNSIPLKTYVDTANFDYDGQLTTSLRLFSPKPYSFGTEIGYAVNIPSSSISKLEISYDDFSDVVLAIADSGVLKEIDYQITPIGVNNETILYHLYFSHPFNQGSLVLYNKANVKKARDIETPVVYAFENDFEGMKSLVDAQLNNRWNVFDKIDDIEQKLYPYYDTDKYLVGVINEGEDGCVDVYKVLETEWAVIPEIQAKQNENGDLIIFYKDMTQVKEYNDFLINSSYPSFEIETSPSSADIIKVDSIKIDPANKTWTFDFGDLANYTGLINGKEYKIIVHPKLFDVGVTKENLAECFFTVAKTWPYVADVLPMETNGQILAKEYLQEYYGEKHQDSTVTVDAVATKYTKYVSNNNLNKYFKVYGLTSDNCIPLDISLSVEYTVDGTTKVYDSNVPYDYPDKYINVAVNVSIETMNKIGITVDNYSSQTVTVLREHNGKVDELTAIVEPVKAGGTIVSFIVKFSTDKMSLFALANSKSIVKPSNGGSGSSTSSAVNPAKKPVVNTSAK